MRKIILSCFIAFFTIGAFAQKNWAKQRLTSRFTASFPAAPSQTASTTFALKDSTSAIYTATYSFIAKNLKVEERIFEKLAATNEFAGEFLSTLQATLPQYSLEKLQLKQHKNYVNYLTSGRNETEKKTIYMNIVFVDGVYYCLSCIVPDGEKLDKKDTFLNAFQITK
ncbi:hypothetical protein [Pedobacter nanyangensis]|uniref:hypothetical protein n=1 Tax=Pedobacter nanyangensis TaxID=1562389 RepID=UPI000DE3C09B|nr:hypothetical protein [Pedobacter nanyangensis]